MRGRRIIGWLVLIAVALPLLIGSVTWAESGCHKGNCGGTKVDRTDR